MSFFELQILAQQIQTAVMKQVAEIMASNLGYCPAFCVSQEPLDHDTNLKLKVVLSFTVDPSKNTAANVGLCAQPKDKWILSYLKDFQGQFAEPLLDNSTISAASPTITTIPGSSHGRNLFFSGSIFAHCAYCANSNYIAFLLPRFLGIF